jgi:hypothetical protein
MNLARTLLNNPGLLALTVSDERKEIVAALPRRRIKFAFFQDDFQGGRIAYWHVMDPSSKSYQSTLSMQGLKDWGVL